MPIVLHTLISTLLLGTATRTPDLRSGLLTSPPPGQANGDLGHSPQGVTLLTPLHLSSDLPTNSPSPPCRNPDRTSIPDPEAGRPSEFLHSGYPDKSWDFAWGANASGNRERRSNGERSPRSFFRDNASPSQYPRSPSSVTASSIRGELSVERYPSGITTHSHLDSRCHSIEGSVGALGTTFLRPYGSTSIPRMSSFSSVSTTDGALAVRSSPLDSLSELSSPAGRYKTLSPVAKGSFRRRLVVVSQEDTPGESENSCPVCVESLDASFRLPGEKAHVIPGCGHVLHEVRLSCCSHHKTR